MNIIYSSDDFYDEFHMRKKQGEVHSVFKRVINFKVDGRIYTIGDCTVPLGPCTAILGEIVDFEAWAFFKGEQVVFESEKIFVYGDKFKIIFENKPDQIWHSQFDSNFIRFDQNRIQQNLDCLLKLIVQSGDPDSIAPLIEMMKPHFIWLRDVDISFDRVNDSRLEWISERMLWFLRVIARGEWEEIPFATRKIIGFGPGLTPSSDDFVVGLMAGLLYSDQNYENLLSQFHRFIQDLKDRTTDISYEALWHMAAGRVNRLVRNAALAVVSTGNIGDMENLLKIGQTSGTDLAVGLYFGIKINLNKGEH